jgi:hypothetical protein
VEKKLSKKKRQPVHSAAATSPNITPVPAAASFTAHYATPKIHTVIQQIEYSALTAENILSDMSDRYGTAK